MHGDYRSVLLLLESNHKGSFINWLSHQSQFATGCLRQRVWSQGCFETVKIPQLRICSRGARTLNSLQYSTSPTKQLVIWDQAYRPYCIKQHEKKSKMKSRLTLYSRNALQNSSRARCLSALKSSYWSRPYRVQPERSLFRSSCLITCQSKQQAFIFVPIFLYNRFIGNNPKIDYFKSEEQ